MGQKGGLPTDFDLSVFVEKDVAATGEVRDGHLRRPPPPPPRPKKAKGGERTLL